jgi:hypothetical protein
MGSDLGPPAISSRNRYAKPGDNHVDASVLCVITRFRLKRIVSLLVTYLDYRRVLAQARSSKTPGLLRSAFLVENPRTCYMLSVWSSYDAIPRFGTAVPRHVDAARNVFGRCRQGMDGGPEVWSTKWRLASVSNNLSWSDFDLRAWLIAATDEVATQTPAPPAGLRS